MVNECFHLSDMTEKHVYMIALNAATVPTGVFEVSHGCINYALITSRELFLRAMFRGALGIVVLHNHTSGEIFPSREDVAACARTKEAGYIIGIMLFDFIVVGNGKYLSFHKEGMLWEKKDS